MTEPVAQPVSLTAGEMNWQVDPECRDVLFGPEGLRLEEWLRAGQAQVVKQGPQRIVYRVILPGLDFHLKHNRLLDLRAWLRELVRPSKACIEYRRARAVAARGVATISPLAWGKQDTLSGPGDSFLITRTLDSTEQLTHFLETTLLTLEPSRQARLRQRLAVALGRFLARMHQAGIVHHDLHPGNLLLRLSAQDEVELFLLDLHMVRVGRPLTWGACSANLVILNRYFILRANRSDRLRFWHAYRRSRTEAEWPGLSGCEAPANPAATGASAGASRTQPRPPEINELGRELERQTWRSNLRFWQQRDRRCLANNRYYQKVRSGVASGHAVRELEHSLVETFAADPDAPFRQPGVTILKDSRSSTVIEFDLLVGGSSRRVIYKRFRVTAWTDPLTALVRRTAVLRSWVHGHGFRERCLPTARPLLVLHRRQHGLSSDGYLLMEKIPGAVDLHRFLDHLAGLRCSLRRQILRTRTDQVAQLVRELHRRHLSHRDLKASNLLVSLDPTMPVCPANAHCPLPTISLIDLVGVRRLHKLPRSRRIQNLARLHASFLRTPLLTRTDKLRFLRVYLQWGLLGKNAWKRWWVEIDAATQAKVARNQRSGRPLA